MDNPYFDRETNAAIGIFKGFLKTEDFKKIAEELHSVRKNNGSNKQLNNIEDMKVLNQEIQDWLKSVWFPKAIESGLKHFAFVVPKSAVGKLSMSTVNKDAEEKMPIEIQYFGSEMEAKTWLKSK